MTLTELGIINKHEFFRDYWQQKPLLIKSALPDFISPVSADELAGLSLESEVESRLVIEGAQGDWQVEHGPFTENRFSTLPASYWTLLVQHLDTLIPEVRDLFDLFRFVPDWRLDDVMLSYASDQGGVGPHFDYYDVFLLQAEGTREWKLGQICDAQTALVKNSEMKLIQNFETHTRYLCEPGDLLYVPARHAHWGVAQGECLTYSIGARAPSYPDIVSSFLDKLTLVLDSDQRYQDARESLSNTQPFELDASSLQNLQSNIRALLDNPALLSEAFAELCTFNHSFEGHDVQEELPDSNAMLCISRYSRRLYIAEGEQARLFIDGEQYESSLSFAVTLCEGGHFQIAQLGELDASICQLLWQAGCLEEMEG